MVYHGLKLARPFFQFPWEMRLNEVFSYDAYVHIHFTFNLEKYLLLGATVQCSDATMDLNNGAKEATMLAIYKAHIVNAKHQHRSI